MRSLLRKVHIEIQGTQNFTKRGGQSAGVFTQIEPGCVQAEDV